ncbi:hypothetical protein A6J64_019770 [Yersinia enterocolitica]|nr:hypothetical protein A6J63_020985 [Yersinia enterocolitica]PNM14058.1 hypothetical protein A6J64_019770 [Yersinia enterocolitica]
MKSSFNIPVILQAACALAACVTWPVHGPCLCEAAANSVQIGSRPICCSVAAFLQLELFRVSNR